MDQQTIIAELENRAKLAGLPMSDICRRANIHPTTFSRWKLSEKNPTPIGATIRSLSALNEVLSDVEARHPTQEAAA